ncbi:YicC family protein [Acidobacteria bacterium AH-259-O06]|nr:YicC family protein [Acidobacteria bacterium AH-259-O06]
MRSMTGFGQAARSIEEMDVVVEIKTVNGRYLDLNARLPKELTFFESDLRKEVRSHLGRGRVDIYINLILKSTDQYDFNEAVVQNYLSVAERVRTLGVQGVLDVATLLPLPGVVAARPLDVSSQRILQTILEAVREALEKVVGARCSEGEALKKDIENRIQKVSQLTDRIAEQAQQIPDHYRRKLMCRIQELTQEQVIDENRLAKEILYYAERSDISEEITRLRSHITHFQEELSAWEGEVIGRRLDFICQEMSREMNTILSKSPLAGILKPAVDGKTEMEKIREQVQNVE